MAQFETIIPFILHTEEGVPVDKLSLPHQQIFEHAKKRGVHYDPDDSGGHTICGVTLATYAAYRRKQGYQVTTVTDLKNISFRAWKSILKQMFWDKWKADDIKNEMVAVALVDWLWHSGSRGIRYPQRLLGVADDGIVGNITLSAVNRYPNQQELFERIQAARISYLTSIARPGTKNAKYLRGWLNRVAKITFNGFKYE